MTGPRDIARSGTCLPCAATRTRRLGILVSLVVAGLGQTIGARQLEPLGYQSPLRDDGGSGFMTVSAMNRPAAPPATTLPPTMRPPPSRPPTNARPPSPIRPPMATLPSPPPVARPPIVRPPHSGRPPVRPLPPRYFFYLGVRYSQFDAPPFVYPRGYRYRRWVVGEYLPRVFIQNRYQFYDYDRIGLRRPRRGSIWVRFGPDLLVVDQASGLIRDVAYNVFY